MGNFSTHMLSLLVFLSLWTLAEAATCTLCSSCKLSRCRTCVAFSTRSTTNLSTCVCNAGHVQSGGSCVGTCDPHCLTCSGPSSSNCLTCKVNETGPSLGVCTCSSPNTWYPSIAVCTNCDISCLTCSVSANASRCTSCYSNAVLNGGINPSSCVCDAGFYPNTNSAMCAACDPDCLTCTGGSATSCTSCDVGAAPTAGSYPCGCVCLSTWFPDPDAGSCTQCAIGCKTCDLNGCLTCYSNAKISGTAPTFTCICLTNFFPNTDVSVCAACDLTCATCMSGSTSSCTSCKSNAQLSGGAGSTSNCVCAWSFYPSSTSANCVQCHPTCLTCSAAGQNKCTLCKSNATLTSPSPNTCPCNTGYYFNSSSSLCLACDSTCQTCSAAGLSGCTACLSNAVLSGLTPTTCICATPGYYPASTAASCQPCDVSCLTCSGGTNVDCQSCKSNAVLSGSVPTSCSCNVLFCLNVTSGNCELCSSTCLDGYFPAPPSSICTPCYPTCAKCSGATKVDCLECVSPATKLAGNPVDHCVCPPGSYAATSPAGCQPCDQSCLACSGAQTNQCSSCYANAKLKGTNPSACECAFGFFPAPDAGNCLQCPGLCATCKTPSICLSCKANSSLKSAGGCECNSSFFLSADSSSCLPCFPTCSTCISNKSSDCLVCAVHSTLAGPAPAACFCDTGFVQKSSTAPCTEIQCDSGCVSCSSSGLCGGCMAHAVLRENKCVCTAPYSAKPDSAHCENCVENCRECSDNTCKSCNEGFTLKDGKCLQCGISCLECISETECVRCKADFWPALTGLCEVCSSCDSPLVASVFGPVSNRDYQISFSHRVALIFSRSDFSLSTPEPISELVWDVVPSDILTLRVTGGTWSRISTIEIEFLASVTDIFGFPLQNTVVRAPPPSDPGSFGSVQTAATAAGAAVAGSAVLASATVGGGSLAMALLSQMQYFSYISTADYAMNGSMANFYSSLNQKSSLPNLFRLEGTGFRRRLTSAEDLIDVYDFLDSSGQFLTILCAIVAVHAFVFVVSRCGCGRNVLIQRVNSSFVWGVYLYFWMFAYLDLQVSSLLQLANNGYSWSAPRVAVCNLIALFFLVTTAVTPFFLCWLIAKHGKELIEARKNNVKKGFAGVVAAVRTDGRWAKYMYPVFYGQRLIYSLCIVFFRGRTVLQSLALILPCGLMTVFAVVVRPLRMRSTRFIGIVAEVDTLIVFVLLCFATLHFNTPQVDISWIIVAFTLKSFLCSLLILFIEVVNGSVELCRKKALKVRPAGETEDSDIKTVIFTETDITFGEAVSKISKKVRFSCEDKSKNSDENNAHSTQRSDESSHGDHESIPGQISAVLPDGRIFIAEIPHDNDRLS